MGKWTDRKKKRQNKYTVTSEIFQKLNAMHQNGIGHSRHKDKELGLDKNRIYSHKTYETYKQQAKRFARYCKEKYPEAKHLKDCQLYINEYLLALVKEGKSAWTIATAKAALAKLFGISYADLVPTPSRERRNIKRGRLTVLNDRNISKETEEKFAKITAATGLRITELLKITGEALYYDEEGKACLYIHKGSKGGKKRSAEIVGKDEAETQEIIQLFQEAGYLRLVPHVSTAFDNHHYRAVYTKRIYNKYARSTSELPPRERYIMRKDRAGEILDRKAMEIASKALGHNRIQVIALSYLY